MAFWRAMAKCVLQFFNSELLFGVLDVFVARLPGMRGHLVLSAVRLLWHSHDCVQTCLHIGCGVRNCMRISLASLSFSLNHHLRKQALDFLFFLVNTHYYSSNEIKGMHFSMQPQCLYLSLSMGNAKEKRGTTLDQPINYVIRFLHHHQTVATSVC